MGKPIDIFENQEQLEECLREWQHRLFLDGWLILAHVEDKIMNPDGEEVIDAAGYNTFVFESSQANIQLLSDESYKENNTLFKHCMEKDLVQNFYIASTIGWDARVEPMRACIWMRPNTRS